MIAALTCWRVRLKLRGPLLTTSSAPLGFGIDAPFARNAAGEYYMAGSLVKGRLKEAWQELSEAEGKPTWNWAQWIGKKPPVRRQPDEPDKPDWESERGLLQFADFVFQSAGGDALLKDDVITYRIQRDRESRTVKQGQNLMIQTPFAAGGEYWFEGRVWAIVEANEAAEIDQRLREGLCFVPALGAETTVGYGVIVAVDVGRDTGWAAGLGWETTDGDRWGIAVRPEGPLCLAGRRLAENIFESEPDIAGGVIKGSLATTIQRIHGGAGSDISGVAADGYRELCEEFSRIRILHAKPVKIAKIQDHDQQAVPQILRRSCAVPLSAVMTDKTPRDAAFTPKLTPVEGLAPSFRIDWKESESSKDVQRYFGVTSPPRELRVRTQIETDKRRALDENLFAYRMLAPRRKTAEGMEEFEWLGEIDFSAVPKDRRPLVKAQTANLLRSFGLPGVGKLKTRCVVDRVDVEPKAEAVKDKGNHQDLWVVTLQTPALLCDIGQIGAGLCDAFAIYREYWREESRGSLDLERLYASQALVGGGYLWKHFRDRQSYRPYVLTDAGSTFVLKRAEGISKATPEECLAGWQRSGLPVALAVREAFKLKGDENDWKCCPYIPQNGFGEIAVDRAWHWDKAL